MEFDQTAFEHLVLWVENDLKKAFEDIPPSAPPFTFFSLLPCSSDKFSYLERVTSRSSLSVPAWAARHCQP
jgi:hypothetical protein